ncbi:MAG: hypothetical protein JWP16_1807 [Alphaproteobacteria bacterium]|jgi:hypothetical protein|nr:hypothetical protein [Alphaproteobacteria bacterium]
MQVVGHFLQMEAIKNHSGARDLYARSAYNRYYYGVFLNTRAMFAGLDSSWSALAHKSYPDVLKGKLTKRFKQERYRAIKAGDAELVEILNAALQAAVALASLMEKAYGVRVVADYKPEELVQFSTSDRFSLKSIDITDAHNWESTVSLWIGAIQRAWKQLHG